jgi:hypothetical protein
MTSLKLFYRRGVPAALLLGLIVGAPDIAQAQPPGGFGRAPVIPPPRTTSLGNVPFGTIRPGLPFRSASPSSVINQTVPSGPMTKIPSAFPPSYPTRSVGTQTDPPPAAKAAAAANKAAATSGQGRASRIISTEGGPEGEAEGDSPL